MRGSGRRAKKTIRSWKQAKALLQRWRRELANIKVELKQPRVIDVVPIERAQSTTTQFAPSWNRASD